MGYVWAGLCTVAIFIAQAAPPDVTPWLERGGIIGLLALAITAFLRGWIHTDKEFQSVTRELEYWRGAALRGLDAANNASRAATKFSGEDLEGMAAAVDEARRRGTIR